MNMLRPSASREDGFTVLELVWSAAILLVVAMGVIGALNFAAESTRRSAARVTALNVATEQLEKARSMPYDSVGVVYLDGSHGSPAGTLPATSTVDGAYNVTTSVSWARDPNTNRALYKKVRVDVAWESGTVNVSTNIFGKSNLVNTGDMSVRVLYQTSNEPVSNVLVTITPQSGTALSVRTDEAGEAFFGYIPSGTYSVAAAVSGYIVDVSALSAVVVNSDTLAAVTAYAQLASSIRVSVSELASDGTTAALSGVTVTAQKSGSPVVLTGTTLTDGSVVFDSLVVGEYVIEATKTGYGAASGNVSVTTPGEEYPLTLSMSQRVGLTIRVIDEAGAIVSGATVTVKGPSPATTNVSGSPATTPVNNGEVTFATLANGTYALTASKTGYTSASGSVTYNGTGGVVELRLTVPTSTTGSVTFASYVSDNSDDDHHVPHGYILHPGKFRITREGYSFDSFWTDANGSYTVTGLAPGTYRVQERMDNFGGNAVTFTISAGETSYVTVYAKRN